MEDLWLQHHGEKLSDAIQKRKQALKANFDYTQAYTDIRARLDPKIKRIRANPDDAVPQIDFSLIEAGAVSEEFRQRVIEAGCCIIRGVFDKHRVEDWNAEMIEYLEGNDYLTKAKEKAGMDQYFSQLASSKPQIYSVYWSKPQIQARQSARMAQTKAFLNSLWRDDQGELDTSLDLAYADRFRRRAPGDNSLGLSPHVDGGSVERWLDDGFAKVYAHIFEGNIASYTPFAVNHRTKTQEIPSPAVCRMFRTYQGWTAMSRQGKGDGTLQLIPASEAMAYILLRALQDDIASDDLCGARPGRALTISPDYHQFILDGLISIPTVEPGDTVWWHADVVHAVEDVHTGSGYSNVIYIGAAPKCPKNMEFLQLQKEAFLTGESSPDFAAENYEVDFVGRAEVSDLSDLGKRQMGFG